MLFRVDYKSGQPVYQQIIGQTKEAVASGVLRPGESLPGIGFLAKELRVNRNHLSKAYSELESLGIIELVPGKGYCLKEQHRPIRKGLSLAPDTASSATANQTAHDFSRVMPAVAEGALYLAAVAIIPAVALRLGFIAAEREMLLVTLLSAGLALPLKPRLGKWLQSSIFGRKDFPSITLAALKQQFSTEPTLDLLLQRVTKVVPQHLDASVIHDRTELLVVVDRFPALRAARKPVPSGDELLLPLASHDELVAVVHVKKKDGRKFTSADYAYLADIAEQFSIAASQLQARSERVESEYALEIQRGLLPRSIPQAEGFGIAGAWQPAKDVGGDYYDVFRLNDDEIALIVADVSGKGAPAALMMANLQATTKAYAASIRGAAELCTRVNIAICESISTGKFITFFYAVLNHKESTLTYCNAGHNPPFIVSSDGNCSKLDTGGTVLGLFPEAQYEEASVNLTAGDRIVIFTDGMIEAADSHEREFGDDRLFTAVTASAKASAGELRDSIMQAVTQFCHGNFADDATLLIVVLQ